MGIAIGQRLGVLLKAHDAYPAVVGGCPGVEHTQGLEDLVCPAGHQGDLALRRIMPVPHAGGAGSFALPEGAQHAAGYLHLPQHFLKRPDVYAVLQHQPA